MSLSAIEKTIGAIAIVEDTDPEDLDLQVQNWIEPDAIRQLMSHGSDAWELRFEVENHEVKVKGDETILIDGEEKRASY
jgi:hypothetical protein